MRHATGHRAVVVLALLATSCDAFMHAPAGLPRIRKGRLSASPLQLRAVVDPHQAALLANSLSDTAPHVSSLLIDACGSANACLAAASTAVRSTITSTPSAQADALSLGLNAVNDQANPVLNAIYQSSQSVVQVLTKASNSLPKISLPDGQDIMKSLPPPVLAAEKSLEVALKPLISFITPYAAALATFIHVISHDSNNDLFDGYPFNAPALVMWAASVYVFSSIAYQDDEVCLESLPV